MKPRGDKAQTKKKEMEVVQILCKLPKLVLEAEFRRISDSLRWGSRRRRSVLDDDSSLLEPPLPPPPPPPPTLPPLPSISPPPHSISPHSDVNEERKDRDREGGGASLSPATPLSFPASGGGGGEPDRRPPFSPPVKVSKITKRHLERVKEHRLLKVSLSNRKAHLQRSIEEYKALQQELKARNSWLQDLQSKGQKQQQDGISRLAPLGPTTLQSPENRQWEIHPPPVDRIAGGGTPSPSVVTAGRRTGKMPAFDLNETPVLEEMEWERSSACKAAM